MKNITLSATQWLLIYSLFKNFRGIEVHATKRALKRYFLDNDIDLSQGGNVTAAISNSHAEVVYNAVGQMALTEEVEDLLDAIADQLDA
jgi:hypothetical protein